MRREGQARREVEEVLWAKGIKKEKEGWRSKKGVVGSKCLDVC